MGKLGELSRLGLPAAASVVADEFGSKVVEAWGVSPTDGFLALASSRSRWRVSIAVLLKAMW